MRLLRSSVAPDVPSMDSTWRLLSFLQKPQWFWKRGNHLRDKMYCFVEFYILESLGSLNSSVGDSRRRKTLKPSSWGISGRATQKLNIPYRFLCIRRCFHYPPCFSFFFLLYLFFPFIRRKILHHLVKNSQTRLVKFSRHVTGYCHSCTRCFTRHKWMAPQWYDL